ncbi:MAG: acyl-CoA dehydrogenase family protein [Alphaproteobacteria bacterium]
MDFEFSDRVMELRGQVRDFIEEHVQPAEKIYAEQVDAGGDRWTVPPIIEELKAKAKTAGLWNMFLPDSKGGFGLSNLDYAPIAEELGRSSLASETFNCSAPDTGNMEILERFGTDEIKEKWLQPLLDGEIRSAFAMTEPLVASSDATNIESSITRDGDDYVINGRKWWTSGIMDPRCKVLIFMGKTDKNAPTHQQQSMIVVPMDTPGITVLRSLPVFGYDDAPHGHGEVLFEDVRVPTSNILLGEGRGFEIAQARLGPGRIHHCMRSIGSAERAIELMCARADSREAFGQKLSDQGVVMEQIANSRIEVEQARLSVLKAAWMMDKYGNKIARSEIAQIKVSVPNMAMKILDRAIQIHGGGGVSADFPLARAYASQRTLRLADGPDEVHRRTIARLELKKQRELRERQHNLAAQ